VKDALDFQIALGKRLVRLGQVKAGSPVNVDATTSKPTPARK